MDAQLNQALFKFWEIQVSTEQPVEFAGTANYTPSYS